MIDFQSGPAQIFPFSCFHKFMLGEEFVISLRFNNTLWTNQPQRPRTFERLFRPRLSCAVAAILFLSGIFSALSAATLPSGFVETRINGLAYPTAMDFAPDGRLFVCLQTGSVRVIKNGALLPTPFVTLTVDSAGERGLLGIAFEVEYVGKVPGYAWLTEVIVILPGDLPAGQDVLVSVTFHTQTSNQVRIRIK
jgi:hypothetical protein